MDAWVTRQPDTRQYARAWLERHLPPGTNLVVDLPYTAAYARWADLVPGLNFTAQPYLSALLAKEPGQARPPAEALALERAWWDPPL